jgi:hypothetical protein
MGKDRKASYNEQKKGSDPSEPIREESDELHSGDEEEKEGPQPGDLEYQEFLDY